MKFEALILVDETNGRRMASLLRCEATDRLGSPGDRVPAGLLRARMRRVLGSGTLRSVSRVAWMASIQMLSDVPADRKLTITIASPLHAAATSAP